MSMENKDAGYNIYNIAKKIFPLNRSLTGDGVRKTIQVLSDSLKDYGLKFDVYEIPSGSSVFDWTIPKEWEIIEGYIEDENGIKILDFKDNNLSIVGYSTNVDKWVDLDELKEYIFTQKDQPDAIPYVTSYYKERFGFCMSENQKQSLKPGKYHMYISSKLFDGSLTYADLVLKGKKKDEILITSYVCHPSMANNECSGPALLTELVKYIYNLKNRKYTYRFVLNPETIGSITYLSKNVDYLKKYVKAGVVLSCVGDNNNYSLIHSRYANTLADKAFMSTLKNKNNFKEYSYLKRGSDERQYNAPGVDLPVVGFCRSKYGEFPEYHTSKDDMNFVSIDGFQGSYDAMVEWIQILENNCKYVVNTLCEPQLGKRGLYPTISKKGSYDDIKSMVDLIAYCDGTKDLIEIGEIIGVKISELIPVVHKLLDKKVISEYDK